MSAKSKNKKNHVVNIKLSKWSWWNSW